MNEETKKLMEEYKKNQEAPSPEEISRMREIFGEGARVVDVISGRVTQL